MTNKRVILLDEKIRDIERESKLKEMIQSQRLLELDEKKKSYSDAEDIMRRGSHIGNHIYCYDKIKRTMEKTKNHIESCEAIGTDFYSGTALIARNLTGAKGRFNRKWHADSGGAWFSIVFASETMPEYHSLYSLTASIPCCELLREYGIDAHLQWVNNIIVENKKIGGILGESYITSDHKECYVLVGMGINLNNEISQHNVQGISAKDVLGGEIDLDEFLSRLIPKFSFYFGLLSHYEQMVLENAYESNPVDNPVVCAWKSLSDTLGREIEFFETGRGINFIGGNGENSRFHAGVINIEQDGSLLLERRKDSQRITRDSGEILYLD